MKQKKNLTVIALAVGLVLMLLGSIVAQAFNTSGYGVKVSRIYFETEKGTLSGLLYMPKEASAENPHPTLVTTHGYLNSAEMQDAPAIEMSRRGYVVLALDMYDHGHSKGNAENTGSFLKFWPSAIWDAVQYMYKQPYVLKDAAGNGEIAVSGHSMGGFSSTMALYYDELAYEATGVRMIAAGLSAGSDYSYTAWLKLTADIGASKFGGRTIGKIAAQYDEFFFNAEGDKGTVNHKDYVSTPEAATVLGLTYGVKIAPNTWYPNADGGKRIIYQPAETHPWNHFSTTTTGYMVEFYKEAFSEYYGNQLKDIASGNQIWWLKEAFECVALIGFLFMLMPLAALLLKLPFLKKAVSGEAVTTAPVASLGGKIGAVGLFLATMVIPGVIYSTMYSGGASAEATKWIGYFGGMAVAVGIIALVMSLVSKDENKKCFTIGSVVVVLAGSFLYYLVGDKNKLFAKSEVFSAGTVTSIATWALVCAMISVIIMVVVYVFGKKKDGVKVASYGIVAKVDSIVASLAVAVIVTLAAVASIFLVDVLFKTDFRIWTFAFKSFEATHVPVALAYAPFFFVYYLVSGASAVANTSSEKMQGVKGYVVACLTNMGGILLWLAVQYGVLFATGHAFYPGEALSGILLVALVPTLIVSSCYTKYLYKKTGNVYAAAFLNALLLTIMTVANTTVYFQ